MGVMTNAIRDARRRVWLYTGSDASKMTQAQRDLQVALDAYTMHCTRCGYPPMAVPEESEAQLMHWLKRSGL